MTPKEWTPEDIPNLAGKIALVTGATSGLGYETALVLAGKGAKVLVGGRNQTKGQEVVTKIVSACPKSNVTFVLINHSSLKSVSAFVQRYKADFGDRLDILVNNAGIADPPKREVTEDGFESIFATNHLSHFQLTAGLLPYLKNSPGGGIVVNVSSIAAQDGKINFEDLNWEKTPYYTMKLYQMSKLANLLFTFELQRRSEQNGWGIKSVGAHPGVAATEIFGKMRVHQNFLVGLLMDWVVPFLSQSVEKGAWSQLYAATSPKAEAGGYYGPDGFKEMKGNVKDAFIPPAAKNLEAAKRLWEISEQLTKVTYK